MCKPKARQSEFMRKIKSDLRMDIGYRIEFVFFFSNKLSTCLIWYVKRQHGWSTFIYSFRSNVPTIYLPSQNWRRQQNMNRQQQLKSHKNSRSSVSVIEQFRSLPTDQRNFNTLHRTNVAKKIDYKKFVFAFYGHSIAYMCTKMLVRDKAS